jgi:hypothetical protein
MSTVSEISVDPERKNHEGEQYLYDGITGRYTYYPAGTFPDKAKLAELNAEQKKVYRDRQNLLFPRIGKRREGLIVVSEVDEVEVDDTLEKERQASDFEQDLLFQKEARRKLRVAKKILIDVDYQIYRKVCVFHLLNVTDYSEKYGIARETVRDKAERATVKVEAALKKQK